MNSSNAADNSLNINSAETHTMRMQHDTLGGAIRTIFLLGILSLLAWNGLAAQEVQPDRSNPASKKFSIGVESGVSFNMFKLDSMKSTASGSNPYLTINGSYAFTEKVGIRMSLGYEEVKWSTSQTRWDLPTSPEIRQAFSLPDSVGSFASPTQSMTVIAPSMNISAQVLYNPTPWLGLMAGFTTQLRVADATVQHTWQADDPTTTPPFEQSASFAADNAPGYRFAIDAGVAITPFSWNDFDFSIHAAYRQVVAESASKQEPAGTAAPTSIESSATRLRTLPSNTMTGAMRIGAGIAYRF